LKDEFANQTGLIKLIVSPTPAMLYAISQAECLGKLPRPLVWRGIGSV